MSYISSFSSATLYIYEYAAFVGAFFRVWVHSHASARITATMDIQGATGYSRRKVPLAGTCMYSIASQNRVIYMYV